MAAVQLAGHGHDKVRLCYPNEHLFAGAAERGSALCGVLLFLTAETVHRISAFPSFLLEPRKADGVFTEHF